MCAILVFIGWHKITAYNAMPSLPHSSTGGTPTHTERTSTLTGVSICFYKKVGYEVVELQAEYQSSTWSTGEGSVLYCWHPGRGGGGVGEGNGYIIAGLLRKGEMGRASVVHVSDPNLDLLSSPPPPQPACATGRGVKGT